MPDVQRIKTKLAGVMATNPDGSDRQALIRKFCQHGRPLRAIPEPSNRHDPNAVGVWVQAGRRLVQVGYVGSHLSEEVADHMRKGGPVNVRILQVTGGSRDKPTLGVNVELELLLPPGTRAASSPEPRAFAFVEPAPDAPIKFGWKFRDLPGLALRKAVGIYRRLPEWAQPIVWGIGGCRGRRGRGRSLASVAVTGPRSPRRLHSGHATRLSPLRLIRGAGASSRLRTRRSHPAAEGQQSVRGSFRRA